MIDPAKLLYAKTHEWVLLEGETATIGITDFAVTALTDLVYIELPAVGRKLRNGETFGVIESVKAANDLYTPIAGEVVGANQGLVDDLAVLSHDPFSRGWMIKLRIEPGLKFDHLMDQVSYKTFCATEAH